MFIQKTGNMTHTKAQSFKKNWAHSDHYNKLYVPTLKISRQILARIDYSGMSTVTWPIWEQEWVGVQTDQIQSFSNQLYLNSLWSDMAATKVWGPYENIFLKVKLRRWGFELCHIHEISVWIYQHFMAYTDRLSLSCK